ncbi:sphingosine phosphate lyase-like protein [Reticulomyxa filosa]|uniref:Sphingosine phosphate lyase-like protein n=1 Tax=Reticulomyxa filosa TaxID=46433 RepID=X6PD59_RETFI|nr:sphingosine phosphate lyase-like protein [Reticulomyxa filosa]|eukprot:ETO35994.1 sphingosine phosphate lyase-like protein [Reticulomyxa filosa]
MFEITPVLVPVNPKTFAVDASEVKKYITKNTIAIVGSSPCYVQGVIDPISELSKLAVQHNIGLHVDCCLGSFMLPTLQRLKFRFVQSLFCLSQRHFPCRLCGLHISYLFLFTNQ